MIPLCPKCGEPPRFHISIREVKVEVRREGDALLEGRIRHAGDVVEDSPNTYECGGRHRWEVPVEGFNPSEAA